MTIGDFINHEINYIVQHTGEQRSQFTGKSTKHYRNLPAQNDQLGHFLAVLPHMLPH
jgi:hypothetical protein